MVTLLLTSLPWSYANLIATLIYGKTITVVSEITATLLSYEQREKESTTEGAGSNEGVDLATRYNQGNKKEKEKLKKNKGSQGYHCKDSHKKEVPNVTEG